jgi:tetratricopeptide (TPR) repeat protein
MAAEDWYRNKEWNAQIEAAFFAKLRRARRKEQYLRIQACILAPSHPEVALRLLDDYFKLKDDFDHAQAYVDRAKAYLALGETDEAIEAYEAALKREEEFPTLQTQAYLDLPFLVVTMRIERRYQQCLDLLLKYQSRPIFPVDRFRWHASVALLLKTKGDLAGAVENAAKALIEARKEHSGFRYHPSIGLVGEKYDELQTELARLCNA